jgi:uncharacterized protein (DUF486 family)
MAEYLKYIPNIISNHAGNAILLTFLPGLLYVLAAYGHLFIKGAALSTSIIVSIIFASLEYIVRVPIIKYSSDIAGMSNTIMQVVWVIITIFLSWISDKVMKHNK